MASNEPIEKLYVKIEADVKELLQDANRAIDKVEDKLDDLDKKAKKTGRFKGLKEGFQRLALAAARASTAIAAVAGAITLMIKSANEAVKGLRAERAFRNLAVSMGQSSDEILAAITRASQGTISQMEAIAVANDALLLKVAQTPEEFEKMARAAVVLGRAKGLAPLESILTFINAAGRRATEVLDNLGLTLGEVNAEMERLAQIEFGLPLSQLDKIQRNMLFTQAAIEVAAKKAEQLGGAIEDAGTSLEQQQAQWKDLKQELGEISLILVNVANEQGQLLFQGETFFQRMIRGAKDWQNVLLAIVAILTGIDAAFFKIMANLRAFVEGRISFKEIGAGIGEEFTQTFQEKLDQLQTRFQGIVSPETVADAVIPMPETAEEVEERSDELMELMSDLATDMLDEAEDRQQALEELERDHGDRMADIAQAEAQKIADINADLQNDLAKLARDTAQERADIMRETQRDLAELAQDTDDRLADERKDFQTDERRDTEDHLRDMRRLTEQYLFDLEDAVKERDARAVVDLQRRFAMESQRREEDFTVNQSREREDFSVRLQEIRENEARRREEILRSQAEALADLVRNEAERRAEIERSHAEQIARAQANAAKLRAKEAQNYAERQADLDAALSERLASVARELADEESVNREGARRILGALSRYFGRGGEIDKLMNDFERRRRQRMIVEVSFEASGQGTQVSGGTTLPPGPYTRIPRFQHGGTLLARKPTLAMFGEAGPEVARFTPLGQGGGGAPQKLQIEFSGSAPPGIRGTERDQIAQVLLDAIRDTGMLSR